MKGKGELWLQMVWEQFKADHPEWKHTILCEQPSLSSSTVTPVEQMFGEEEYVDPIWDNEVSNDRLSCSSFRLPSGSVAEEQELDPLLTTEHFLQLTHEGPRRVVPDLVFSMDSYPGVFPLVVEIKSRDSATDQIFKQMLSKMHFQDVVFGLTITPMVCGMCAIIKEEGHLHFIKSNFLNLTEDSGKWPVPEGSVSLDYESVRQIYKYIYSVLLWACKSKCKISE